MNKGSLLPSLDAPEASSYSAKAREGNRTRARQGAFLFSLAECGLLGARGPEDLRRARPEKTRFGRLGPLSGRSASLPELRKPGPTIFNKNAFWVWSPFSGLWGHILHFCLIIVV